MASGHGYELAPNELAAQVRALAELGDRANGLVASASRLAQRVPPLGTAPPALHLAMRLHEAAGETGLTGEMTAASTELNGFHTALGQTVANYLRREEDTERAFREKAEGGA